MYDPYLYDDVPVLKNLLNIKDSGRLERAEADITYLRLYDVDGAVMDMPFTLPRLLTIHKHIFGDIYEWAGQIRTIPIAKGERILGGDTIRYSNPDNIENDCDSAIAKLKITEWGYLGVHETAESFAKVIAALWQTHPFREGNTRTIITFATQFAEAYSFRMNKNLLQDNAAYVRDALAKASDGPYAEIHYLVKIFEDAIRQG